MSKYQITGPDGASYEVTAPEGASESDVLSYVKAQSQPDSDYAPIPQPTHIPTPEPEPMPYGTGMASQTLQGAFGVSDEAMAGMDVLTGGEYNPEKYRRMDERFAKENTKAALAAQVFGALVTGGYGASKVLGSQVVRNAPKWGKVAAAIGVGAGEGALAGAGHAQEGERLEGAVRGGTTGGGIGATIPAGAMVGKKIWDYGLKQVSNFAGDRLSAAGTVAGREIMRALDDAGMTFDQAISRLRALGKDATLADIVPHLGETAASVGGRATNAAERVFGRRSGGQADRIVGKIDDLLTKAGLFSEGAKVTARRAAQAKSAYRDAYDANPIMVSDRIKVLLDHPRVKLALKHARIHPKLKDLPDNSIELLDQAYKEIGKAAHTGPHALKGLQRELREALVSENPYYGKALVRFADDSRILDAMDEGRKLFRMRPEQVKQTIRDLGETEVEAFRIGAADEIRKRVLSASDTANAVRAIFKSPEQRALLRSVFPSRKAYRAFELEMQREIVKAKTAARVLANSATARREAGQRALGQAPGGAVHALMDGKPLRAAGKAVGSIIQKAQAPRRDVADELAPLLYNKNMLENWDTLVQLGMKAQPKHPQLPATTQALARALMGGAATTR